MRFSFEAKIYKVGINACVKVPISITSKMTPVKGYVPVKGKINHYAFTQTLVPVKNAPYRLFVNLIMLKGSSTAIGDTVKFSIEQNFKPWQESIRMSKKFKETLVENNLLKVFNNQIPSRQKEILRYLNHLKTEEALTRNVEKVIRELKKKS
jgi:hypothetical protein